VSGVVLALAVVGYVQISPVEVSGPSNPLLKSVDSLPGAWLGNYFAWPILWVVPILGLLLPLLVILLFAARKPLAALLCSGVAIAAIIASVGVAMFPFILPSSLSPDASLTVWDSSSSHLTLFVMLVSTALFLPIILAYTSWVYS